MLLPILAALLELAAVRQSPMSKPPQQRTVAPKPVSPAGNVFLAAAFQVTGSRLEITYTVENKRDREIYVLDVKEDLSPPYFLPQSPRVRHEPPATAVLACWWEYVPSDPTISWVHPPVFYATPVAADEAGAQRLESAGRSLVRLFQTARAAQRVLRTEEYPVRIPMLGKE